MTREQRLERCLGFFASVIKSGEPWTATCEAEYRAALSPSPASTPSAQEEPCPRCEKRKREGVRGPVCDHREKAPVPSPAAPDEEKGLWVCICGAGNFEAKCIRCGTGRAPGKGGCPPPAGANLDSDPST